MSLLFFACLNVPIGFDVAGFTLTQGAGAS